LASPHLPINTEFEQTDLTKLFKGFLDDMDDQVREKMATVSIEPLPILRVSRVLMRSLFQNLIRSALHYSKQEVNPVISVRPESDGTSGNIKLKNKLGQKYTSIIFEDNGVGFDEKRNGEMLDGDGVSEKNGDADGYKRLAVCKKIMETHDGFISTKTEKNGGSAFIVSFPVTN